MTLLTSLLSLAGTVIPLIFKALHPPDLSRRERRDASQAKSKWWGARRRLHLAHTRGVSPRAALRIEQSLARWAEELERLGEDMEQEEADFQQALRDLDADHADARSSS